jgi:dipeptidyl aminopeptidase/acylaminoacyl peptidase
MSRTAALPVSVIGGLAISADGSLIAFAGSDARHPSEIWLLYVRTKLARPLRASISRSSRGSADASRGLDDREQSANAITDVKAAADLLVRSGIAQRIGVMGESYGGWLTLAVVPKYPETFAAAVISTECWISAG